MARKVSSQLTRNAGGWLDWHILAAIFNIVMNYRFPVDRSNPDSEVTQQEMIEVAFNPESATAKPVPIGFFGTDAMNENRWLARLSLLKQWGLECHQKTPDMPAIERLLADRYGYWDEDVPHDDPFPNPGIEKVMAYLWCCRMLLSNTMPESASRLASFESPPLRRGP